MFNKYRIPKDNLLSKTGDIDEHGNYSSPIKDNRKRLGASLGALSAGRVNICNLANVALGKAITIATRYSAARRQFGPEETGEEWAVIEYQSQVRPKLRQVQTWKLLWTCTLSFSNIACSLIWPPHMLSTFSADGWASKMSK